MDAYSSITISPGELKAFVSAAEVGHPTGGGDALEVLGDKALLLEDHAALLEDRAAARIGAAAKRRLACPSRAARLRCFSRTPV